MWNPNLGKAKVAPALASPASYVEAQFSAMSGVAYHVWVRMRAQDNSTSNDSLHIQFSDAVTGLDSTTRTMGFGTTSSAEFIIQEGPNANGPDKWGWADNGWGAPGAPIYFQTTGTHTLRIQAREDGPFVDQIVISPTTYFTAAPGPRNNDLTILAETPIEGGGPPTCGFTLSAPGTSMTADGGQGGVDVQAPAGCAWTATSQASWISVTGGGSGSGNGTVSFSVEANPGAARNGTLTVGEQTYTVSQSGVAAPSCSAALSAASVTVAADAGSGSVDVIVAAGCAWSAASNASWITVTAGSGNGSGTVSFDIAANTSTERTGTLTIAGSTYTVSQAAAANPDPVRGETCAVTLDKTTLLVGAAEANWVINVTADSACTWTATADSAWLVVKSTFPTAQPVRGTGYVKVRAVANTTGVKRIGQFVINGVAYTVTQGK